MILLPIAATAFLALLGRLVWRSWMAPGPFLALCWSAYLAAAYGLRAEYPLRPEGLWVITSMILAFSVGSWVMGGAHSSPRGGAAGAAHFGRDTRGGTQLIMCVGLFSFAAAVGVGLEITQGLSSFSLDASLASLIKLGGAYSLARYGDPTSPVAPPTSVLVYLMFAAAPLGGVIGANGHRRPAKLLAAAPLILCFIEGAVTAARAGFVLGLVMWLGGYFVGVELRTGGQFVLFNRRRTPLILLTIASLFVVYMGFQWLRGGGEGELPVGRFLQHAVASALGGGAAFSEWYALAASPGMTWGGITFAGLFDVLGLRHRAVGLFEDSVVFPNGEASNIFTLWRSLIMDFSLGGSWILCALAGGVCAAGYRRLKAGSWYWAMPLALFYSVALFSPLASMLYFNSILVAWLIAYVCSVIPFRHAFASSGRLSAAAT